MNNVLETKNSSKIQKRACVDNNIGVGMDMDSGQTREMSTQTDGEEMDTDIDRDGCKTTYRYGRKRGER